MISITDLEIQSLLQRVKDEDERAFKEFFFALQPNIFHFLYRYTSDRDAAEDLTQETFIKFWLNKDHLDLSRSPKAYLFKIARNLALNHVTRKPPVSSISDEDSFLINLTHQPEEDYDRAFLMDDFQRAVNMLPDRCRATFILSRYHGFEYSEIAEILEVSLQTVKNQMNKAISVLRKRLAAHLQ